MQLRSQAQHAWATAVETTGAFIRQALKSSQGEEEWLRFFALMGTAIAIRERAPPVPGTPENVGDLTKEIKRSARKLDVVNRLNTFGLALQKMENTKGAAYYILLLDPAANQVSILGFPKNRLADAQARYLSVERSIVNTTGLDAVLVSVDSVNTLQKAYPNYFLDTRAFAGLVEDALKGVFS